MFILAGQIVPLSFFPDSYINIINYTPIPYLIYFPVEIAMSQDINVYQWISMFFIGILWCIIMRLLSGILYNIGIRRYEAYGS